MQLAPEPLAIFSGSEHEAFRWDDGPLGELLIHGFPGTPAEMRPLARALQRAGVSVEAPLLPGFGAQIQHLPRMRAADWVEAAADAWESLRQRHPQAALIGFSMGGSIALQLAARRPPQRLVLLAPLWRMFDGDWRVSLLPLLKHVLPAIRPFVWTDLSRPDVAEFFRRVAPHLDLADPRVQARLRRETRLSSETLDQVRRLGLASIGCAPRVSAPTLVIQGNADTTVTPRLTRLLAKQLRGPTRLEEVPCDHLLIAEERPAWPLICDLVVRFVADPAPLEVSVPDPRVG